MVNSKSSVLRVVKVDVTGVEEFVTFTRLVSFAFHRADHRFRDDDRENDDH